MCVGGATQRPGRGGCALRRCGCVQRRSAEVQRRRPAWSLQGGWPRWQPTSGRMRRACDLQAISRRSPGDLDGAAATARGAEALLHLALLHLLHRLRHARAVELEGLPEAQYRARHRPDGDRDAALCRPLVLMLAGVEHGLASLEVVVQVEEHGQLREPVRRRPGHG